MKLEHTAFIRTLEEKLTKPLPGHDAFLELSGYKRPRIEEALRNDPEPRESAVLALLYPEGIHTHTMLIERPKYDGVHSGQVAFPGGRREPEDNDLQETALREFEEETGMATNAIHVLGPLSRLYIPPSRSLVTPFVAVADELGALQPDPTEVQRILHVPLLSFLQPDSIKRSGKVRTSYGNMSVPYFDAEGQMVWGATAMMIAELREMMVE